MFLMTSLLYFQISMAQTALNLNSTGETELKPSLGPYLFVQENCEACKKALILLSQCDSKTKNNFTIVAMA